MEPDLKHPWPTYKYNVDFAPGDLSYEEAMTYLEGYNAAVRECSKSFNEALGFGEDN